MKLIKYTSRSIEKLCDRSYSSSKRVETKVRSILDDVKSRGDEALLYYTKKFDKIKMRVKNLKVSEAETNGAYQNIDPNFVSALKVALQNINRFYERQKKKSWRMKGDDGIVVGENYTPIENVGIYVPSGSVPLVSTVYMTVLPAKLAGVERIVIVTPPNKYGSVDPHILVVANLLKVREIYKAGGAQGIGALAFGTKTFPRVDKIVGPGNIYVTEAKRQVYGYVDIDMFAGPSEVVIIAGKYANPDYVAADLKAQSEHTGGVSILVTNSKKLANHLKDVVKDGYIVLVRNLDEAADVSNRIAPEHLQIMVRRPAKLLKKIKNAGAVFLGQWTPSAVGDYVAGPSHVLPTGGTARFFSGLAVNDFLKSSHIISYSKKALEKVRQPIEKLAEIEGLQKHSDSIRARF